MSRIVGVRSYPAKKTLMGIDSPLTGAPSIISYLNSEKAFINIFPERMSIVGTYLAIVSLSWNVLGPDPVVSRFMMATSMCLIFILTRRK